MKYLSKIFLLILLFYNYSCGTIKEGFTNQKKNNSDEFLIEKKNPLSMPPNYENLPDPNMKNKQGVQNEESIKELIIDSTEVQNNSNEIQNKSENQSNLETSIIEKIKK